MYMRGNSRSIENPVFYDEIGIIMRTACKKNVFGELNRVKYISIIKN